MGDRSGNSTTCEIRLYEVILPCGQKINIIDTIGYYDSEQKTTNAQINEMICVYLKEAGVNKIDSILAFESLHAESLMVNLILPEGEKLFGE